jgi:hypothetical protein
MCPPVFAAQRAFAAAQSHPLRRERQPASFTTNEKNDKMDALDDGQPRAAYSDFTAARSSHVYTSVTPAEAGIQFRNLRTRQRRRTAPAAAALGGMFAFSRKKFAGS